MSEVTLSNDNITNEETKTNLVFDKVSTGKRFFANIMDIIMVALLTFSLIVAGVNILRSTSWYGDSTNKLNEVYQLSHLYNEDYELLCDELKEKPNSEMSLYDKNIILNNALTYFYSDQSTFFDEGKGIEIFNDAKKNGVNDDGEHLFKEIIVDGATSYEEVSSIDDQDIFDFYFDEMANKAVGFLNNNEVFFTTSRDMFYISLAIYFISGIISIIIFYLMFPLIFHRGYQTLGKKMMNISIIGVDAFNISYKRYLARFSIFLFVEVLLSIFTFLIPLAISLTMSIFNVYGFALHDYFLNTYVVDTKNNKIYLNKSEYLSTKEELTKVSFRGDSIDLIHETRK